jgi:hypothetical protein
MLCSAPHILWRYAVSQRGLKNASLLARALRDAGSSSIWRPECLETPLALVLALRWHQRLYTKPDPIMFRISQRSLCFRRLSRRILPASWLVISAMSAPILKAIVKNTLSSSMYPCSRTFVLNTSATQKLAMPLKLRAIVNTISKNSGLKRISNWSHNELVCFHKRNFGQHSSVAEICCHPTALHARTSAQSMASAAART